MFIHHLMRQLLSQTDPRQGQLWGASLESGHIWAAPLLRLCGLQGEKEGREIAL
jgi:hypothetical protein